MGHMEQFRRACLLSRAEKKRAEGFGGWASCGHGGTERPRASNRGRMSLVMEG